MTLLAKGTHVAFDLTSNRKVDPPSSYALLHDPRGIEWPENEGLIGPYQRSSRVLKTDAFQATPMLVTGAVLGGLGALAGGLVNSGGARGAVTGGVLGIAAAGVLTALGAFNGEMSSYFGTGYTPRLGDAAIENLPRKAGAWRYVGEVHRIWYERTGERYTGPFQHPFERPVALYKHGRWYRLVLPRGAVWNWRGFVDP